MGSTTSFLGFSCLNLLLFLNLLFLGTCIIFFSQVFTASVGTFSGSLLFIFYFSVPYFGLACDHGNSSLCLEE